MIPGAFEIQIIVSIVVVMVAALAALICDYLKGNNDWLRLKNTELTVRVEERERFFSPELWVSKIRELLLSPEVKSALVEELKPAVRQGSGRDEAGLHGGALRAGGAGGQAETWASKEELGRLAERAARIRERHEAAQREKPQRPAPEPQYEHERVEESPAESGPAAPDIESIFTGPVAEEEAAADFVIPEQFESEALTEGDSDLDELFDRTFGQVQWPTAGEEAAPAVDPERPPLPSGLVDPGVFEELLSLEIPVTGVVAAVSINDFGDLKGKASPAELASVEQAVGALVTGMLNSERAFACRIADDQYVLVFDGEVGAAGQRILFQLSERLWDFQLRSLGRTPVVFSWGGLEVSRQTIANGVEAAQERMRESRRSRKVSPVAISPHR
jgi:hypothetical protein